jgi:hypothetical protein
MAITRPKPKTVEEFVGAAPDAGPKRVRKGRKIQISHTIAEDMLGKIDAVAKRTGQSRAAIINLAIYRLVESGV